MSQLAAEQAKAIATYLKGQFPWLGTAEGDEIQYPDSGADVIDQLESTYRVFSDLAKDVDAATTKTASVNPFNDHESAVMLAALRWFQAGIKHVDAGGYFGTLPSLDTAWAEIHRDHFTDDAPRGEWAEIDELYNALYSGEVNNRDSGEIIAVVLRELEDIEDVMAGDRSDDAFWLAGNIRLSTLNDARQLVGLERLAPPPNTGDVMAAATEILLNEHGIEAYYEHPGYISVICSGTKGNASFGDANGDYGGNWENEVTGDTSFDFKLPRAATAQELATSIKTWCETHDLFPKKKSLVDGAPVDYSSLPERHRDTVRLYLDHGAQTIAMKIEDYQVLIAETAERFIEENQPASIAIIPPSTAFDELIGDIVDRNWSDEDAISCLQFSEFPSAEEWNHGSYQPATQQEAFPFKVFAHAAFAEDVKKALNASGFDWEAYDKAAE